MKRFRKIKKSISILLAMLIVLSSLSIIGVTAVTTDKQAAGATLDEVPLSAKFSDGNEIYKIWETTSYGLRFNSKYFPYKFTNQINGKSVTYPASWGAIEYEYAHNTENNKNTAVWCAQPGVVINGADYGKITVDKNGKITTKGGNTEYWDKLNNSSHKNIKKALSAVIAYGKGQGGAKSTSPYYYATSLLVWDFVMGIRNVTAPYDVKSGKTSNIYKIYNTVDNKRVMDVQNAAKDIIKRINDEDEPLAKLKSKSTDDTTRLYKSINEAKKDRTKKIHRITLPSNKTNGKYTGTTSGKFASLKGRKDITYTVVNQNGNETSVTKNMTASLTSKGKIQVSSSVSIFEGETTSQYYVKITKTPTGYTKGATSTIYQSKTGANQTMINLGYAPDDTIAYLPIFHQKIIEKGSLVIDKTVTSNVDGYDVDSLLEGWTFKVVNKSNNNTVYLVTNSEGSTGIVEDIPLNTTFEITEIGREIKSGEKESDFYNVTTYNGKKYGMPNDMKDVTTNSSVGVVNSKTVKVTKTDTTEVEWTNKKEMKFPLKIKKETSDGDDASGYYFFIYDYKETNLSTDLNTGNPKYKKVIEQPTIIGPTDKDGYVTIELDNLNNIYLKQSLIYLVELGKLKDGESETFDRHPKAEDLIYDTLTGLTNPVRSKFEIPKKYTLVKDSKGLKDTGLTDTVTVSITEGDVESFYKAPDVFEKVFIFTNRAEGKIKLKKLDAVTKEAVKGATYGIFEYSQNNGEDDYIGESEDSNGEYYEEQQTTEDTNNEGSNNNAQAEEGDDEGDSDITSSTAKDIEPLQVLTTEDDWVFSKLLPCGTYYVQELSSPNTHVKDDTKHKITIEPGMNTDETALEFIVEDKPSNVEFYKLDSENVNSPATIEGAEIKIYEKPSSGSINYNTANAVYEFTTGKTATKIIGKLEIGKTYIAHEAKPPKGYYSAADVEFTVSLDGSVDTVKMIDEKLGVKISKTDITGNKEIPGCKLKITDKNGNTIIPEWTSTDKVKEIRSTNFEIGKTYTLVETYPADGYVTAKSVDFIIKDNGKPDTVTMKDDTTKVQITKTDMTGTKEVKGCKLELTDKTTGKKVDSWTSSDKPHYIEGKLVVGHTYILSETYPADGYATAKNVEFTVKDKGEIQPVEMKDDTTKVEISKTDITGTKEIPGCKLKLTDKANNTIVDSWTSGDKPHYIEGELIVGHTYILSETYPADGYTTAKDVEFTVNDTGDVQPVKMQDDTTKVQFSKTDMTGTNELPGCNLELKDKADNTIVDSWTSTDKPYYIEGKLIVGHTYILTETKPVDGYTQAESVEFTVKDTGEIQKVHMRDDITRVKFSKTDITGTKEIPGCKLLLTDLTEQKMVDTWTSTTTPHYIVGKLVPGHAYQLTEISPADGYTTAEKKKFVIKNTGEIQTVTMKDAPTKIEIRKRAYHISDDNFNLKGAKIQIKEKGKKKPVITFTTTSKPKMIVGKLVVGKTYVIKEVKAPSGYKKAKVKEFTVKDTSQVQSFSITDKLKSKKIIIKTGGVSSNPTQLIAIIVIALSLFSAGGLILATYIRKRRTLSNK